MKHSFFLYLDHGGNADFGRYQPVVLFPTTHKKGNTLWLPYHFIIDMSKALVLSERRNFRSEYLDAVSDKFQMIISKDKLINLPLVDVWNSYKGQMVLREYEPDKCFGLKISETESTRCILRKTHMSSELLYEWKFSMKPLLDFFSEPRYHSLLWHSGFVPMFDQLQLKIEACS